MSWLCHILVYLPIVCKIEIILTISWGFLMCLTVLCICRHKKGAAVGSIFMTFYFHYHHQLLFIWFWTAVQWASSIIKKPGVWESLISIIRHICYHAKYVKSTWTEYQYCHDSFCGLKAILNPKSIRKQVFYHAYKPYTHSER